MEKKEYIAPRMNVIEMKSNVVLLQDSDNGAPDGYEYDGEFGFNGSSEANRQA